MPPGCTDRDGDVGVPRNKQLCSLLGIIDVLQSAVRWSEKGLHEGLLAGSGSEGCLGGGLH